MAENKDFLQDMLGSLLADPAVKEKMGGLLDMLVPPAADGAGPPAPDAAPPKAEEEKGLSLPSNTTRPALSGGDPMQNVMAALSRMHGGDDPRLNLLNAIRPYLRPGRVRRLEVVVHLLQLGKMAPLLTGTVLGQTAGQNRPGEGR